MSAVSVFWILVCSFGLADALGTFDRVPLELPSVDSERRVWRRRIGRSARGAAIMTFGLGVLLQRSPEIAAPLWAAFGILCYVAIVIRRRIVRGLYEWTDIAVWLTLGAALIAFVEGIARGDRGGMFLIGASAVLAAAAQVDFMVDRACRELADTNGRVTPWSPPRRATSRRSGSGSAPARARPRSP